MTDGFIDPLLYVPDVDTEELEPDVDDDALDDSVSDLYGTNIPEVELPDFDPTDFVGDENANN